LALLQAEAKRVASKNYLLLCQRKGMNELTAPFSHYKREFRSQLKQLDKDEFDLINTQSGNLYMVTKVTS